MDVNESIDISQVYLKETRTAPLDAEGKWQNIHVHSSLWLSAVVKMQGTVFIFHISAIGNSF